MTKAFDTVNRRNLLQELKEKLEPDELHILSILIKDVSLKVKIRTEIGESKEADIGIAQGDCLSTVLFIFYLARSMDTKNKIRGPSSKSSYYELNSSSSEGATRLGRP